jgi:hypothetical protein
VSVRTSTPLLSWNDDWLIAMSEDGAPTMDASSVEAGWHRARAALRQEMIALPAECDLQTYVSDEQLDASNPRDRHYLLAAAAVDRKA